MNKPLKNIFTDEEWNEDMSELETMSQSLNDILFTKRIHPSLVADSKTTTLPEGKNNPEGLYKWMMKEFGHSPIPKYQFLYEKNGKRISCIRGGVSFGKYEIFGKHMDDPERFSTAEEVIIRVKELLG